MNKQKSRKKNFSLFLNASQVGQIHNNSRCNNLRLNDCLTIWQMSFSLFVLTFESWKAFGFSLTVVFYRSWPVNCFPFDFYIVWWKKMNLLKYVRKQISPSDESRFVLLNFSREYEYVLKHFKCRIKNCGALNSFEGPCTQLRWFAHPN